MKTSSPATGASAPNEYPLKREPSSRTRVAGTMLASLAPVDRGDTCTFFNRAACCDILAVDFPCVPVCAKAREPRCRSRCMPERVRRGSGEVATAATTTRRRRMKFRSVNGGHKRMNTGPTVSRCPLLPWEECGASASPLCQRARGPSSLCEFLDTLPHPLSACAVDAEIHSESRFSSLKMQENSEENEQ